MAVRRHFRSHFPVSLHDANGFRSSYRCDFGQSVQLQDLLLSKTNIQNVLAEKEEAKSQAVFSPKEHDISFHDVSFSYVQGEVVLKEMRFSIPDCKLTAIVGDSGSGKSTILNLIAKLL